MPATLDMFGHPRVAASVLPEGERTSVARMAYEGFWAVSGVGWEVVDDDRIAANPINRRDPSGLRISRFDAALTAAERAEITAADASATAHMARVRADLLAFNMANFVADPAHPYEPDPHDIAIANSLLTQMREKLDSMILHLASGIEAKSPWCTRTVFGTPIYAKSVPGKDIIWFAPAFFTAAGANPILQTETIIHELSHIAIYTNDDSFASLQASVGSAVSILNRDGLLPNFLNSAYFWEDLGGYVTTSAMLNGQLLRFVFRAAGTSPTLPMSSPPKPAGTGIYPI
jgi:hypothetical protein